MKPKIKIGSKKKKKGLKVEVNKIMDNLHYQIERYNLKTQPNRESKHRIRIEKKLKIEMKYQNKKIKIKKSSNGRHRRVITHQITASIHER